MLPEIGATEMLVIAAVALIVVGPKDLPLLMRRIGQFVAKLRGMASEFRASFDEMARQSELDELRKEVQALRDGQGAVGQGMVRLGDEANAAFKGIQDELEKPAYVEPPPRAVMLDQPEFPEPETAPVAQAKPRKPRAPKAPAAAATAAKPRAKAAPKTPTKAAAPKAVKSRAPRNSKLDL